MRQTVSNRARAATSPSPTLSSHTRPAARNAWPAEITGSSCGYASPAAGWPAPTTHRTSTPTPTTKRPTTPSPSRCDRNERRDGATSINVPSDISSVGPVRSNCPAPIHEPDVERIPRASPRTTRQPSTAYRVRPRAVTRGGMPVRSRPSVTVTARSPWSGPSCAVLTSVLTSRLLGKGVTHRNALESLVTGCSPTKPAAPRSVPTGAGVDRGARSRSRPISPPTASSAGLVVVGRQGLAHSTRRRSGGAVRDRSALAAPGRGHPRRLAQRLLQSGRAGRLHQQVAMTFRTDLAARRSSLTLSPPPGRIGHREPASAAIYTISGTPSS